MRIGVRGALPSRLLVLLPCRFRIAGFLSKGQPFGIDGIHEDVEPMGVIADDPVVTHVLAESEVADWPLASESAIIAVVLKGIEGPEIELVPAFWLKLLFIGRDWLKPVLVRIFRRQSVEPLLVFGSPRAV